MLVTDFAYRDMETRSGRMLKRFGHIFGAVFRRSAPAPTLAGGSFALAPEHTAHLRLMPSTAAMAIHDVDPRESSGGDFRWRRHPQLLTRPKLSDQDPHDIERGARSAAVRGLFLARSGRFGEARSAFAMAASEPTINLTAIPGFWDLPRGGMLAAVRAYEDVKRFREASALGAQIRLKYRPRSISTIPEFPARQKSASGS